MNIVLQIVGKEFLVRQLLRLQYVVLNVILKETYYEVLLDKNLNDLNPNNFKKIIRARVSIIIQTASQLINKLTVKNRRL